MEFVLVGGMAAILQGAPIVSFNLDIVHRRSPENVARLLVWLLSRGAFHRLDLANRRCLRRRTSLSDRGTSTSKEDVKARSRSAARAGGTQAHNAALDVRHDLLTRLEATASGRERSSRWFWSIDPAMRILALALSSAFSLAALNARADDRAAVWDRHFAIGLQVDALPFLLNSAFAVLEVAPVRWASLEVGGGVSVLQQPAALAMLHLQIPIRRLAPGIEGGFLMGPLRWDPGSTANGLGESSDDSLYYFHYRIDMGIFGRLGAALAFRVVRSGRLQVRAHGGVMGLLNQGSSYCVSDNLQFQPRAGLVGCRLSGIAPRLPYLGASVSFAFNL